MLWIILERFIKADVVKAAEDDLSKIKLDDATVQLPEYQLGIWTQDMCIPVRRRGLP